VVFFLVWVQAAFGEELVFRGFLLTRLELVLAGGLSATAMALVGQALLFGVPHWYLGPRAISCRSSARTDWQIHWA